MPILKIKDGDNIQDAQFPDGMSADDIRSFLRAKYSQQAISGESDILQPRADTIAPYNPSLVERAGGAIASGLKDTGLISDNYQAQQIGKNLTSIGEFLPGIGDATAGDEFGTAAAKGDYSGMALAGLGVIPVAGDLAKKGIKALKPHQVSPASKEWSDFDFDEINRDAFGVTESDVTRLKPSELNIKWTDDLENVEYEIKNSGKTRKEWAKDVDLSTPIDVILEDGVYKIDDGHHRYSAAKILGKDLPVDLRINDQPFVGLAKRATERGEEVHPAIMKAAVDRGFKPQSLPMGEVNNDIMTAGNLKGDTNEQFTRATNQTIESDPRRIRGNIGFLDEQGRQVKEHARSENGNLHGLPSVKGFTPRHNPVISDVAKRYVESTGAKYTPPTEYAKINPQNSMHIAEEFELMKHNPQDPETKEAYSQMIEEVKGQYQAALDGGLKVDFVDFNKSGDPYPLGPRQVIADINDNNHMYVFSTRDGFGSNDTIDVSDNPLLAETDFMIGGKPALANDLFRVVHDYFGHAKEGVGFRASGEENTWRSHASMFSPLARRAMTSETRGQNSWLNYGPHGSKNRTAKTDETIFADQKIGLMPEWVSDGLPKK